MQVHDLLKLYNEINVPPERLLFKIPSTWQAIEASRLLESEGIQTHLTFVYSFAQAAAAAQAGTSVIQIFVGRIRDWHANILVILRLKLLLTEGKILVWLWCLKLIITFTNMATNQS
ncbi:hypothetical protein SLEP1_g46033 [Rubroshorea leprosula]|uniref:Transaldolase n=1 Tax=Rubroshorea leprosula TaxID=152421 RepID=A0AAV5LLT9_9ROSI|nr:hypothetical protein SLEP1_g46033 [Rubroshorea leprosula]